MKGHLFVLISAR